VEDDGDRPTDEVIVSHNVVIVANEGDEESLAGHREAPVLIRLHALEQDREDRSSQQQVAQEHKDECEAVIEHTNEGHEELGDLGHEEEVGEEAEPAHNEDSDHIEVQALPFRLSGDLLRSGRSDHLKADDVQARADEVNDGPEVQGHLDFDQHVEDELAYEVVDQSGAEEGPQVVDVPIDGNVALSQRQLLFLLEILIVCLLEEKEVLEVDVEEEDDHACG